MIRYFVYALAFNGFMILDTAGVASLNPPYRYLSLSLIVGLIILSQRSVAIGAVWLALTGIVLEARGLGVGQALSGIVAAVTAVTLTLSVFAKRSFWALIGITAGTSLAYVATRVLWLIVLKLVIDYPITLARSLETAVWTWGLSLVMIGVFGLYIRRLLHWSRAQFVTKHNDYDLVFPP